MEDPITHNENFCVCVCVSLPNNPPSTFIINALREFICLPTVLYFF